jgi:hypothetical protein
MVPKKKRKLQKSKVLRKVKPLTTNTNVLKSAQSTASGILANVKD